jgi:DNA polymerase III epsilon subunit family exonuclease
LSAAGLLARQMAEALASSPRTAAWLAREVLGLSGPSGLLEKAAASILRDDPRFVEGDDGAWRLRTSGHHGPLDPGPHPLRSLSFAVVDVETTGGGYDRGDRITEIAVVPVEAGVVGDGFATLVNPGCPIPPRIQSLTGITNPMVAGAPPFEAVAAPLAQRLEGRIFTAHNVKFDWGFVGRSLAATQGAAPELVQLCTVRMGRALIPGLSSYGLDSLTRHFRIEIRGRHRAWGDALATAHLLVHLLNRAESEGVEDWDGLVRRMNPGSAPRRRPPRRRSSPPPESRHE